MGLCGLEKRKSNVNFLGPETVKITNIYYTKTLYLKGDCVVDLYSLKKLDGPPGNLHKKGPFPFYVYFYFDKDQNCYLGLVVYQKSKERIEMFYDNGQVVHYKNNDKTYSANVWVDD